MFIEFFCPTCQQRLRVPESSAGKQAKCPSCEQINDVPSASVAPTPVASTGPTTHGDNPFATPNFSPQAADEVYSTSMGMAPWHSQKLEASYSFSNAWALFQKHIGVMVGAMALMTAANYATSGIQSVAQAVTASAVDPDSASGQVIIAAVIIFFAILQQVIQVFLTTGLIRILLEIARGGTPDIKLLVTGGPWFLRCLGGTLLYGLMVGVGLIALIVPGVYLGLRYWSYMHFIIDKNCTISEAFQQAGEVGSVNMGESLLMLLLACGVNILGILACCIGILASAPITSLAWTIGYLMITGQSFRQDAPRI